MWSLEILPSHLPHPQSCLRKYSNGLNPYLHWRNTYVYWWRYHSHRQLMLLPHHGIFRESYCSHLGIGSEWSRATLGEQTVKQRCQVLLRTFLYAVPKFSCALYRIMLISPSTLAHLQSMHLNHSALKMSSLTILILFRQSNKSGPTLFPLKEMQELDWILSLEKCKPPPNIGIEECLAISLNKRRISWTPSKLLLLRETPTTPNFRMKVSCQLCSPAWKYSKYGGEIMGSKS